MKLLAPIIVKGVDDGLTYVVNVVRLKKMCLCCQGVIHGQNQFFDKAACVFCCY